MLSFRPLFMRLLMKVKELSPQLFKRGIENVAYKNILSPLKKTFSKNFFRGDLSWEIATTKVGNQDDPKISN
jgi:hypothetical protein